MKRKRPTPEEIIKKLRAAATLLAAGQKRGGRVQEAGSQPPRPIIAGGRNTAERRKETVKRLKALEKENAPLKKLVANQALDLSILKEVGRRENGRPGAPTRGRAACAGRAGRERAPGLHRDPGSHGPRNAIGAGSGTRMRRWPQNLRPISAAHPRAGYRMATALLRRAGLEIDAQRVQRLWRQEGLKVPRRQRKRQRPWEQCGRHAAAGGRAAQPCLELRLRV